MPDQGEGRCVPCCRLQCMAVWPGPGGRRGGQGPQLCGIWHMFHHTAGEHEHGVGWM